MTCTARWELPRLNSSWTDDDVCFGIEKKLAVKVITIKSWPSPMPDSQDRQGYIDVSWSSKDAAINLINSGMQKKTPLKYHPGIVIIKNDKMVQELQDIWCTLGNSLPI